MNATVSIFLLTIIIESLSSHLTTVDLYSAVYARNLLKRARSILDLFVSFDV